MAPENASQISLLEKADLVPALLQTCAHLPSIPLRARQRLMSAQLPVPSMAPLPLLSAARLERQHTINMLRLRRSGPCWGGRP